MADEDVLAMDHTRSAHEALDAAVACARTTIQLATADYKSKEDDAAAEQKAIINAIGAVLHLGAALVYAIEGVSMTLDTCLPGAGRGY